jgi:FkbM family methyltransferase
MDVRLAELLGDGGVFVEAGANDGFRQSNTYYLERFHGWSGVLVEPIPELADVARRRRTKSRVINCALVAEDFPEETVTIRFRDLMSSVDPEVSETSWGWERAYDVAVRARTLTSVLEEAGVEKVDLMSLDVEGHEASVLDGLDLERFGPKWLLIEVRDRNLDRLSSRLPGYAVHEWLTEQDALLVRNGSQRTDTR